MTKKKTGTVCYDLAYDIANVTYYNTLALKMPSARQLKIKFDPTPYPQPMCEMVLAKSVTEWTTTYVR